MTVDTRTEIEKYLQASPEDFSPYMVNEIFNDLAEYEDFTHYTHIAYAYTYYYLTSYLYFNTKYGTVAPLMNLSQMNLLLNVMGVATRQRFNYISKKGGVLDTLGYTETSTNYPVFAEIEDNIIVGFTKREDFRRNFGYTLPNHKANFKCKVPLKCLHESSDRSLLDGRQFFKSNTHFVHQHAFMKCMSNPRLGFIGFYVYGYLRYMYDKNPKGFLASNEKLKKIFKYDTTRTREILKLLEAEGLIKVYRLWKKPNAHHAPKAPYCLWDNQA